MCHLQLIPYLYIHFISVHPCDTKEKGGCSHTCQKNEGEEEEEDNGQGYICKCPSGFQLGTDNQTCKKVHPCERKNNGGCSTVCNKVGPKAECSCYKGFELLPDKMTCAPIHPCKKKSKGGCSHTCMEKGLGVACACPEGYELEEDLKTCERG